MAIKCANCKEHHETIADVRACFTLNDKVAVKPASPKAKAYYIGLQAERNLPDFWVVKSEADLDRMDWKEVSTGIDMLKSFTRKARNDEHYDMAKVPAGRYALLWATYHEPKENGRVVNADIATGYTTHEWKFFEVQDGKGRWAGVQFVKRLIGAPGDYQKANVNRDDARRIAERIAKDPQKAMTDYGLQSGVCGRCSSPLTDPESLARGIGPVCIQKLGW